MSEKVKQIVAQYLKVSPDAVTNETLINRERLGNSILIHRMYATLSAEGFNVENYSDIQSVGELFAKLGQPTSLTNNISLSHVFHEQSIAVGSSNDCVGIDIEDVTSFSHVPDFREDSFYMMNFTQNEIAYCILRPNPLASFAGLFAVKEALVKAENRLKGMSFNALEIKHNENGKPYLPGYEISISHTDNIAIAIVLKRMSEAKIAEPLVNLPESSQMPRWVSWVSLLALILSLLAVVKQYG